MKMLIIQPYSWNMFYMILFLFFPLNLVASDCVCGQGASPDFTSLIGNMATGLTTTYPWLSLVTGPFNKNNQRGMCSGALVNEKYVAIDESCFDYSDLVNVQFPFENINVSGKVIKTKQDYTLIELDSKINTTSLIQPACIPSPGSINLTENSEAIATYFNETGMIHRALMKIVPNDDGRCKKVNFGRVLESDKICAIILNNATFCPESVGIPLTVHVNGSWFLIGISYLHKDCSSNVGAIFTNFKDTFDTISFVKGDKCIPPTLLPVTSTTEGDTITSTTEGDIITSTTEGDTITSTTQGDKITSSTQGDTITSSTQGDTITSSTQGDIVTSTTDTSSKECDFTCVLDAFLPEFKDATFTIDCDKGFCSFRNRTEKLCEIFEILTQRILTNGTSTTPSQ